MRRRKNINTETIMLIIETIMLIIVVSIAVYFTVMLAISVINMVKEINIICP